MYMVYFWVLNSVLLACMFILVTVPSCFDYYNFVEIFEIRKYESSTFILSQDCLASQGTLNLGVISH